MTSNTQNMFDNITNTLTTLTSNVTSNNQVHSANLNRKQIMSTQMQNNMKNSQPKPFNKYHRQHQMALDCEERPEAGGDLAQPSVSPYADQVSDDHTSYPQERT